MSVKGTTAAAIVPVWNGATYLRESLPALIAAGAGVLDEVVVVDDGSSDDSAAVARELGARVVPTGACASGPARARNLGASAVDTDAVVFVDADVVVHADAVRELVGALREPGVVAAFGSYDAHPPHEGFVSQYVNLRHHHGHRTPSDDAATFWSGLGAVRREAFTAVGGFDVDAFPEPSVEDIDLGRRLRAAGGRIRRDPTIQGTHLKRWTLAELVRTDVTRRAIPWARMMLRHPGEFGDLNVSSAERLRALLALALAASLVLFVATAIPAWVPLALAGASLAANPALALVFLRANGVLFTLAALALHQLYYLYGTASYAWCLLEHRLGKTR